MLLTNLILLLALVVMVGIAIWLFRDGEGVGPTPYIRPFDDDGGTAGDERPRSESSPSQTPHQATNPGPSAAQDQPQTRIRVPSDADTERPARSDDQPAA